MIHQFTSAMIAFTHNYRMARGWAARRVYVTPDELYAASDEGARIGRRAITFDGAQLRKIGNETVCAAIREWDVQR